MIVGLTGGMGSGKTTVGNLLKDLGVPVYNSDVEAKKLMESSKKLRRQISDLFGANAYNEKTLNRSYIAKKVFDNKKLLRKLNSIVHPAVRKHFIKWIKKQNAPYVVQETALLFENKSMDAYDQIVLVTAPLELKINRIMQRDGSDKNAILKRIENQLPDSEKIEFSDHVIENIDLEETRAKVEELNAALLAFC